MRPLLAIGIACFTAALAQGQCPPLFPRLHARLHTQSCPCPCVPLLAVAAPEPPKKVEVPVKVEYATIRGKVLWPDGPLPKVVPMPVALGRDQHLFGAVVMPNNLLIDPVTRGVKNVVVWLRPDNDDRTATFPFNKIKQPFPNPVSYLYTIRIKDAQYEPHILAVSAGDSVQFQNNTPVTLNVHYDSDAELFNVVLPTAKSQLLKKPLEAQRTPITFKDDIHPWMSGRIRVFDHPYYATTDKDGNFEIKDAPVGKWRIVYWHEDGYHQGRPDSRAGHLGFPIEIRSDRAIMQLDPIQLQFSVKK